MNDDNNETRHDPYSLPAVMVLFLFLILLTAVLGFVGGWGVAMGLMFAGVL